MGFDLYGIDPQTVGTAPTRPETDNWDAPEWKQYYEDQRFYEQLNPGVYFRSNVWYWRPIVIFLNHIGAPQDMLDRMSDNSGNIITTEEITPYVNIFSQMLEDGSLDHYIADYKKELQNLPMEVCHCCNGKGKLDEQPIFWNKEWLGDGIHDCHVCEGSGEVKNFQTNYPMDKDVLVEFFEFAKLSGGFQVC